MITPAEFEDKMMEITAQENTARMLAQAYGLMCKVLECLGYTAGVKEFQEALHGKVGDDNA